MSRGARPGFFNTVKRKVTFWASKMKKPREKRMGRELKPVAYRK